MLKNKIVEAVRSVIGDASPEKPIALHEPLLIGNESKYVQDCITKNQVTQGEYIGQFEQMLCDFTGAKYAIATCNATCALHTALVALNKYDELTQKFSRAHGHIKIPSLTFVATGNAVLMSSLTPELTETDGAELPVDLLGIPQSSIEKVLLRDSSQALGTEGLTGTRVYSFNANKIITTGGGGAVVTDDKELADKIRHLISTARIPHPYKIEHDSAAFNYRMPNINAALGCAQMEQLPYILKAKRALAKIYVEAFLTLNPHILSGIAGELPTLWKTSLTRGNNWLTALMVEESKQTEVIEALFAAGYQVRPLPKPLHLLPQFQDCRHDRLNFSTTLWKQTICLPSSPVLGLKYA